MSYGINEGIEDLNRKLRAYKAIQKLYPGARLSEDRWVSDEVPLEKCDGFDVVVFEANERQEVLFRFYQTVGEGRVYSNWGNTVMLQSFIYTLKTEDRDLYDRLLQALKAKCS